ncbi:P1 family peptidase [Candidatus Poribacteria bacterium]|nr:P1 family peptidase [Candidatus Poribacteria bacterium]
MINKTVSNRPRAREIGLQIGKLPPAEFNAITDVEGVLIGHTTLIEGHGALEIGKGPIRTGVTAILPHPRNLIDEPVEAAHFVFNGAGTTSGLSLIDEFGQIETPILLTNTFSVGAVYDGVTRYLIKTAFDEGRNPRWFNPTVGETYDGGLNDAAGLHIKAEHVFAAIENARSGNVAEGNVGAGTGTSACGFKAGIGTSSRCVEIGGKTWTVGALVQSNFGGELIIDGVPIGELLTDRASAEDSASDQIDGSIMVILATDAPLSSRQLHRLAKRGTFGLARTGSNGGHGSGDYFIAFSTSYRQCIGAGKTAEMATFVQNESRLNPLFCAVADAVEEAILNSIFRAETMTGRDGRTVPALPMDAVIEILRTHGKCWHETQPVSC